MKVDKEMRQEIEKIAAFASKIGLVFPSAEIYRGFSGFWDFGPTGVEVKSKIKEAWWKDFVRDRPDIVGIDGSIITHPEVWKASGHVDSFTDPLVLCLDKCKKQFRADHIVEDQLKMAADGLNLEELDKLIKENNLTCPECGGKVTEPKVFSLMFNTKVGPVEPSVISYLRPETAQSIFVAFKNVLDTTRLKLPFGIAQIGKVFRNEISPRNFLFRVREFELMEFEFFTDPEKSNDCDYSEYSDFKLNIYHRDHQKMVDAPEYEEMNLDEAIKREVFKNSWQAYWLAVSTKWFHDLKIKPENLRLRQHVETELSHYATDTWDIEYRFPFGWKELQGCANRGQFDLSQHQKFSKKKLEYIIPEEKRRFNPHVVAEPSVGVGRILLTLLFEHYYEEEVKGRKRIVLKIPPRLAPIDAGVFPLRKDSEIKDLAYEVYELLKKEDLIVIYDTGGSIGKRYRRLEEIGVPVCITIDTESLEDRTVTLRDRDSMRQIRLPISDVYEFIRQNKKSNIFNEYPEIET
ncbi:MAG: glycine--tRNA ligase [Candidatus Hodarchaeales archaeon]